MTEPRPGPTNSIIDVPGVRVGHCTRAEPGWLTGVTVVVAPRGGAVCGVDVRGGGPGTRETDLLDPRNLVDRVDAVVLSGGSAFGLRTADGVVDALADDGAGWPVESSSGSGRVPIVPAAILFDLGRGGTWRNHPGSEDGARAYWAASAEAVQLGSVGAGTGARAGSRKGGVGSASIVLDRGVVVAALVVVNAVGEAADPATGSLYAADQLVAQDGPAGPLPVVAPETPGPALPDVGGPGTATTIGVIATDAVLTKAQCQKLAGVGHDGLARAIRPLHTLFDGDTLFAMATGHRPVGSTLELVSIMEAGAQCLSRAVVRAVVAADPRP